MNQDEQMCRYNHLYSITIFAIYLFKYINQCEKLFKKSYIINKFSAANTNFLYLSYLRK